MVIAALRQPPVQWNVRYWGGCGSRSTLFDTLKRLLRVQEPDPTADSLHSSLESQSETQVLVVDRFEGCRAAWESGPHEKKAKAEELRDLLGVIAEHGSVKAILLSNSRLLPDDLRPPSLPTPIPEVRVDSLSTSDALDVLRALIPGETDRAAIEPEILEKVEHRFGGHLFGLQLAGNRLRPGTGLDVIETAAADLLAAELSSVLLEDLAAEELGLLGALLARQPAAPQDLTQQTALFQDQVATVLERLAGIFHLVQRQEDHRFVVPAVVQLVCAYLCKQQRFPPALCGTSLLQRVRNCLPDRCPDQELSRLVSQLQNLPDPNSFAAIERAKVLGEWAARNDPDKALGYITDALRQGDNFLTASDRADLLLQRARLVLEQEKPKEESLAQAEADLGSVEAVLNGLTPAETWKGHFALMKGLLSEKRDVTESAKDFYQQALEHYGPDPVGAAARVYLASLLWKERLPEAGNLPQERRPEADLLAEAIFQYRSRQDWRGLATTALLRSEVLAESCHPEILAPGVCRPESLLFYAGIRVPGRATWPLDDPILGVHRQEDSHLELLDVLAVPTKACYPEAPLLIPCQEAFRDLLLALAFGVRRQDDSAARYQAFLVSLGPKTVQAMEDRWIADHRETPWPVSREDLLTLARWQWTPAEVPGEERTETAE